MYRKDTLNEKCADGGRDGSVQPGHPPTAQRAPRGRTLSRRGAGTPSRCRNSPSAFRIMMTWIPLFYTQTCIRISQQLPSSLFSIYVLGGKENSAPSVINKLICIHNLCQHSSKPGHQVCAMNIGSLHSWPMKVCFDLRPLKA